MPFHYQCPTCRTVLRSPRDVRGRQVRCLGCQAVFGAVPLPTSPPIPAPPTRPVRRVPLVPVIAGGALLTALALAVGIVIRLNDRPTPPVDPPFAPAGTGAVTVTPPDPPIGGSEPTIPQSLTVYFEPAPGQGDEEDVPPPAADPEDPAPGPPDPTLPEIRPSELRPVPPAREPKIEAPRPPKPTPVIPPAAKPPVGPPKPAAPKPPAVVAETGSYAAIDAHALAASPAAETSLGTLAAYLSGAARTDRERARAAFRWVTDRIPYDVVGLRTGNRPDSDPAVVLRTRNAVCAGYARLFNELCVRSGLEAEYVVGYPKTVALPPGTPLKADHAWSAVKCDGRWHLVDATWGAGSVGDNGFRKEFKEFYFLTDPALMIFTHLPEDDRWQLREPRLTVDAFARRPLVRRGLFELGVTVAAVEAEIAAPGFRDVVQVFDFPSAATKAVRVPVGRHLKAGTEYKFEFQSDDLVSFAFIRDGKFIYLKRDGRTFRGTVRPTPGPLMIGAKGKGGNRAYAGILDYVVE